MKELAEKAIRCCRRLSTMTEEPGRTTRTFLSPPMRDVHEALCAWMRELGMTTHIDAAGNLRGLWGVPDAPRLVIGSHLDTVPDAGAFDGILGVVLGVALLESIGIAAKPDLAVEVVGFSEEEGVRFGFPFIGSRAFTGTLGEDAEVALPAIRAYGLDPAELSAAHFSPLSVAYLEFHIEQGPVLESLSLPLGIVDSIVGQSRYQLTFTGRANHAGTTPMHLRHDALAAASEWICEVERAGITATVGSLHVAPNAGNIVPGEVQASLDVRHRSDAVRHHTCESLLRKAGGAAQKRGVTVTQQIRLDQPAVPMNDSLRGQLARAVEAAGYLVHHLESGAGHDAMIIAPHLPSAMLFLRSPGGISHHPDENVLVEDVEAALKVGAHFLRSFVYAG